VCSITINATVESQLEILSASNDKDLVEKRLFQLADAADIDSMGPLDLGGMKGMPDALKHVRKQRIGRHRVFYTGHYTHCTYHAFYIKINKRTGIEDEADRRFQKRLAQVLHEPVVKTLGRSGSSTDSPPESRG
jgi:hypothetical protein